MAWKNVKNHKEILAEIYQTLYDAFGPQQWWPGDTPFEIAIGAILTQNTNWGNVEKAIGNLKRRKALSVRVMHGMDNGKLAELIRPAGYFNVKTKRLKAFLTFLLGQYRGSMEDMAKNGTPFLREQLLEIHGIGPETADSILLYALEKPIFVIDAYTKRVLQRHGLVKEKTSYSEMQGLFQDRLHKDAQLFNEYHALLVRLGKEYCRPRPKCAPCPLRSFPVVTRQVKPEDRQFRIQNDMSRVRSA